MSAYAIVCDARHGRSLGIDTLAMVDRSKTESEFWTSDKPHLIMRFLSPKVATKVASRFVFNNPRVVEYEFARDIIERQNMSVSV